MTESVTGQLLAPADGLPEVAATDQELAAVAKSLIQGIGPIALDAERASGYRYSSRAYLIQIRRADSGTHLIDPIGISDFAPLADALRGAEWILHAATQDLPCLMELGLRPESLFDTELAGRLLGREKVGLSALLESELGFSLAKEHSAADWSTRPLPEPWLVYAALDVELLLELRAKLADELSERGRDVWAAEEFAFLTAWRPAQAKIDPWRRTSGLHAVRQPEQLAIVRELWNTRDAIAQEKDKAPGRVLPDAAIIDIAKRDLRDHRELARLDSLRNRGHKALAEVWFAARQRALALPAAELPPPSPKGGGLPPPKVWVERNPDAWDRWQVIRPSVVALAEELEVAPEILVNPEAIRRLCWEPGEALGSPGELGQFLAGHSVRRWQRELVVPRILDAIANPGQPQSSANP